MKLRVADRILVAVAGLLLLAGCAGIIAQMFFSVDVVAFAGRVFTSGSARARAALIALSVFLFLLGMYCIFVLFRHRKRRDKFILQRNDSGELAISIKALESMVNKCVEQHEEIHVQGLRLENQKDGLLIGIRGSVAGGISIPLTVEALQRQIKQYVTACSGVEVKNIRVQIESSDKDAENAPFAIEAPASKPLLREENTKPAEKKEEPAVQAPAAQVPAAPETEPVRPAEAPAQVIPEVDEEDDRPLHQRLFKAKPEPCIVPAPPAEEEGAGSEADAAPEAVSGQENTDIPAEAGEEADAGEPGAEEKAGTEAGEKTEAEDAGSEEEKKAAKQLFADSQNAFDKFVSENKSQEEIEK